MVGNTAIATASGTVMQNGVAASPEAHALGGAVFVDNGSPTGTVFHPKFNLTATAGNICLISGNTANGVASGIHFGSSMFNGHAGYFWESFAETTFSVAAAGEVLMYDPVTVEAYRSTGAAFQMNIDVDAGGAFVWGGRNVMDANGGATVSFLTGTTTLAADFTLTTSNRSVGYRTGSASDAYARDTTSTGTSNPLSVVLASGTTLALDAARNTGLAAFDFTSSSVSNQDGYFTAAGSAIDFDYSRNLLSVAADGEYLLADGIGNNDRDTVAAGVALGANVSAIYASRNNQLWIVAGNYDSPYQAVIDSLANLSNAAPSLEALLANRTLVSQAQFNAVAANLHSATPDHVLDGAIAGLFRMGWVAGQASALGAAPKLPVWDDEYASTAGYASLTPRSREGYHVWGGYLGLVDKVDAHSRYHGYKEIVSGFVTGVSRDFACVSLGGYFGYTGSVLRMRGANGRVDADGYHFGLTGSITPSALPGLSLAADVAYGWYDNDSRRFDGVGNVSADFGRARLTPFASARYIYLDQDSANERGGVTATRVKGLSGNSFQTEVGARVSGEWSFACGRGTFSPYGSASWRHEFGDRDLAASAVYGAGALPSFRMRSVERDRDMLGLAAGVAARYELSRGRWLGMDLGYDAAIGKNGVTHSVAASLTVGF